MNVKKRKRKIVILDFIQKTISSQGSKEQGSETISKESTPQAIGGGSAGKLFL